MSTDDDLDGVSCAWSPARPDACAAAPDAHVGDPAVPATGSGGVVSGGGAGWSAVLPIRPIGGQVDRAPLFCLPGEAGAAWSFAGLLGHLDPHTPVYGLQTPMDGPLPGTVAESALRGVAEIRRTAPHGPYRLLGWSAGGFVAHEIAVRLRAAGERVEVIVLGADPAGRAAMVGPGSAGELVTRFGAVYGIEDDLVDRTAEQAAAAVRAAMAGTVEVTGAELDRLTAAAAAAVLTTVDHRPSPLSGDLIVGIAGRDRDGTPRPDPDMVLRNWRPYVDGTVSGVVFDAAPDELVDPASMPVIADLLTTTATAAPARTTC
ncbi:thioesterase domain-containing protein [Nocardia rhizosphaerae]|uniref:Thioesterase domain-containing protein n=1 Tax=Nocardia rhizosphaerae TaxID=1691571 RepID=A0ABV8L7X8_9NOCA